MKTLTIDIETSPSLGYVWGLFQQNLALNQLDQVTEVMCFAAKWLDKSKVEFYSTHHHGKDEMVRQAWRLLDEADAVIHYNGASFDIPHLNREFLLAGLTPPSPYKQIDLMLAAKKKFRFISRKLQHITEQLELSGKLSHTGFQMWRDAMAGDEKAWNLFRRYNIQDVRTTEELYFRLLPWIDGHPHQGLFVEDEGVSQTLCPRCGKDALQKRGFAVTDLGRYQRYHCQECGGWSRGKKALALMDTRGVR